MELTESDDGLLMGVESKLSALETELCIEMSGPWGSGTLASM